MAPSSDVAVSDRVQEEPGVKLTNEWFCTDKWDGSSAVLLPMEARGLYREMLTAAWRRGARLPNDPEKIQRAIRCTREEWDRCWTLVAPYWREEGEHLVNDTQLAVYADSKARSEAASAKAAKAAAASPQVQRKLEREVKLKVEPELTPPSKSTSTSNGLTATETTASQGEHEVNLKLEPEDYGGQVWDAWRERRGRGGPEMSSNEWDLIRKWWERGVPLRTVLRGIADCGGQLTRKTPLTYARPAVEDAIKHRERALNHG